MSSPETIITVPDHLLPAHTEHAEAPVLRSGERESYAPRTSDIELNLTPEQTAARLAEKEANERLMMAAKESVEKAYAAADAAKHEQMQ